MAESYLVRKGGGGGGIEITNYVETTATVRAANTIKKGDFVDSFVDNFNVENFGFRNGSASGNFYDDPDGVVKPRRTIKISERTIIVFTTIGGGSPNDGLYYTAIKRNEKNQFTINNTIRLLEGWNILDGGFTTTLLSNNVIAILFRVSNGMRTVLARYDEKTNTFTLGAEQVVTNDTSGNISGNWLTSLRINNNTVIYAWRAVGTRAVIIKYNINNLTFVTQSNIVQSSTTIDFRPWYIGGDNSSFEEDQNYFSTTQTNSFYFYVFGINSSSNPNDYRWRLFNASGLQGTSITLNYIQDDFQHYIHAAASTIAPVMRFYQGDYGGYGAGLHRQDTATTIDFDRIAVTNWLPNGTSSASRNFKNYTISSGAYNGFDFTVFNKWQMFMFLRTSAGKLSIIFMPNNYGFTPTNTYTERVYNGTNGNADITLSTNKYFTTSFNDGTTIHLSGGTASNNNFFLRVFRPVTQVKLYLPSKDEKPKGIALEDGTAGQTIKIASI